MGRHYSPIDDSVRKFIEAQPIFFVGPAPLNPGGRQLSSRAHKLGPQGLKTYRREKNQHSLDLIPGLHEQA